MSERIRNFSNGLYVSGPADDMPAGTLRRAKSVSPLSVRSVKSRYGSSSLIALTVNAAHYFNDLWWYFSSSAENIQVDTTNSIGTAIAGTLGDNRPTFTSTPPTAGIEDYLFVCAEDKLIKFSPATYSITEASFYKWTASGTGTEYYCEIFAGGDPGITNSPDYVVEDANGTPNVLSIGTIGALTAGQWVFGDNDALGYSTVYVRLTDSTDPDTKADGYVSYGRGSNWGIDAYATVPSLAVGAAGNPDGIYKYRFTYYNSVTGTRSNPNPIDTDLALLLHMDGADEGVVFTDSSDYTHAFTAMSDANTEQSVKKFGTASYEGDGNGDGIWCADHIVLNPYSATFTIDWWVRFPDVTTTDIHTQFCKYQDAHNYFEVRIVTGATDAVEIYCKQNAIWSFAYYVSGITLAVDTFYHFALIRGWLGEPHKWAICQDGVALATWTYTGSVGNSGRFVVGAEETVVGANSTNGFIDEFRFINGRANWTEDSFAVPTAAADTYTITVANTAIDITGIIASADIQVDSVEIWRTVASGSVYFLAARIPDTSSTYTDNTADGNLSSTELPLDNIRPYSWFDDCWANHNASVFWITRTQSGQRGRLYYSPIGRAEAVEGFIEVTGDDDILQRVVGYAGMLFVISESGVWQVLGNNPYIARAVPGIPGTTKPYTVAITNLGPMWEAEDGVHLFRGGASSEYMALEPVRDLFRGVTVGGISGFSGTIATYGRGEYYISDGTTTLALDLQRRTWREPGLAATALAYSRESDQLLLGITSKALDYEKEGTTADDSATYTFTIETPQFRAESDSKEIIQHITIDADTTNESLTATLVYDDEATLSLGTLQTNGRLLEEFPVGKEVRNYGLRLSGSIDAAVEIFEVSFETHTPITERK